MKMLLENQVLLSNNFFHTNLLIFCKKNSNHHKSQSLMQGASNLANFIFLTCFFPFLAFLKLQPIDFIKSRSHDGLPSKGL